MEARKSKIKVPVNLAPGENSLLGFQAVIFLLRPYRAEVEKERDHVSHVSSYRGTDFLPESPLLMT